MIAGDKGDLRKTLAAARASARLASPLAPLMLAARPPTAALRGASVLGAYVAIGDEMDPLPLMRRALRLGARLALPRTPRPLRSGPLSFHFWTTGEPLEASPFGVPEPLAGAPVAVPDVLLVPLLGFDRNGGRLGYGAGCFDRTLFALRSERTVFAIGVAYAAQEAPFIPQDRHDERLDAVVTEREWIASGPCHGAAAQDGAP